MTTADPNQRIERAEIEDTSLLAFYRDMNAPERRTFWACAAGWALDGMDFMIYPLVIGTIIVMWKVDPGTAGLAGTVTLLASAIGGWLGGYLADRIGRVGDHERGADLRREARAVAGQDDRRHQRVDRAH